MKTTDPRAKYLALKRLRIEVNAHRARITRFEQQGKPILAELGRESLNQTLGRLSNMLAEERYKALPYTAPLELPVIRVKGR